MSAATASIALQIETKDFATKVSDASTALFGLNVAAGVTSAGLRGLGGVARTSIAEMALGAVAVDKLSTGLGTAATNSGVAAKIFGELSNIAGNAALATTAVNGLFTAYSQFSRVPSVLATISASGINVRTIQEFDEMKAALLGNQEAVEGFANSAIARLGQFEQAAARSATILKSSVRFDDSGNALRVNSQETLENALSIQRLVGSKLDNAVTSSAALLGQYEVLSAGFVKQSDSEQVLETALKLTQIGEAGGMQSSAAENAKLLSKSLQAYNLGAGDAARTGAILNGVVENGITTIQELSNGFGAAGSSASKAGISMSALGAGVAQLTGLGQDTSEALTGLKGLSDAIINKTPEAAAELAKLSLNGQRIRFDVAEVQAKGLVQALLDVNKATGNSPQILAKIFPDAVTSRAVTGLLSGDGAGFKAKFESINAATAQSLDDVAKLASDTRVNKMEKLANKFGEIIITIAQSISPVIEPGLDALKRVADGFNAIPEPIKKMLGQFIVLQITSKSTAAGLGTIASTLGNLALLYGTTRALGLLFGGQLGAELTVIKELIVQRKGLVSVILQTIGVNQRYRLGVDATSAALANQGVIARGVGAAAAKGAEVAGAASNRLREIFARNVAGARAAAAEFGATPTAGRIASSGAGIAGKARELADTVVNSQTGQNVRQAARGFLDRNPAIGTAIGELKGVGVAAIDKVKDLTGKAVGAVSEVRPPIADLAERFIPDPGAADRARLQQMVDAELKLNQAKLTKTVTDNRAKFAELDKETAYKQRIQDGKNQELSKKEFNFNKKSERLEEIKGNLSATAYDKAVKKLNQDAQKIKELRENIQQNALPLAESQRSRARLQRQLTGDENRLAAANIAAQQKFTSLVNLESRLQRVNERYESAKEKAILAEQYAANVSRIAPGSAQAAAANKAASLAAITQSALAGRAQRLDEQYQELLTTSGARTALLEQAGLRQVRFGGRDITYDTSSKLQSLLYADVGKTASTAIGNTFTTFKRVIEGGVSGALAFLSVNATRAAIALGNLGNLGLVKGIGDIFSTFGTGLKGLPGKIASSISTAFASGGVRGVIAGGFNAAINAPGALASRALPFLPAPLVAAVAPLVAATAIGAIALRDDFARNKLAGEFRESVDETLRKDRAIKEKFEGRNRPLSELKSAVENLSQGKEIGKFTAKSPTETIIPTESSVFSNIFDSPKRAIGGVVDAGSKVSKKLDGLVAPEFKSDVTSTLAAVDPIRNQLKMLATAGELTTDQFKDLDNTLAKMGVSGKVSADELAKFAAKLDGIRNQETPQARGVVDSIGNAVYMAPGQLGRTAWGGVTGFADLAANTVGGLVGSGAKQIGNLFTGKFDKFNLQTFSTDLFNVAKDREADALISYIGREGKSKGTLATLIDETTDANAATRLKMFSYKEGTALDSKNIDKMKAGQELTKADIAREKIATDAQIERNKSLVANYDKDIANLEEQLGKQQDAGNKAILQNSIDLYKAQKSALDKNTEALNASSQAFAKYNEETLPGLNRALKENSDPTGAKAVGLAAEDFNAIYQKDSEGKDTKYIKDIAKLRDDARKYIEAIATKYSIDNSAGAESEAIANLKAARDNQITTSTGQSGYRQTINQRLGLTDQIVKIQAAESQKIIASKTLEAERLKALTSAGVLAEREAQNQSINISIEVTRQKLAAKEREIGEYAQFPRKVVELEQEAAAIRVQIEQQVADQQKGIRERDFALTQARFDRQLDGLKTAQAQGAIAGADLNERSSAIELAKTKSALDKLYADRSRLQVQSPELNQQIARVEQQYAQQQAEQDKAARERRFALNQARFDLRSEAFKTAQARLEVGGIEGLEKSSAIELAKAKAALDKLYIDRARLTVKSPELNQQITRAEQQYAQQQANSQTQLFEARLGLEKQLIGLDATRASQPLSIQNKQIESAQKVGEMQSSILSTNRELLNSSIEIQQNQLSNESKLSNSIVGRAQIELTSAKLKLDNLGAVQAYERQSLILQQELTKLSFAAQQNQLNISRIEAQRTIKELELQRLKLNRDKSNSPEIRAQKEENELQLQSAKIQLDGLNSQSQVLSKQAEINKQVTDAKLKQSDATNANTRETERINVLLADVGVKTSKITTDTERQNLAFTDQLQGLNRKSNILETQTKQLDNQSKILTTQKGLISATADSRVGELGILDGLTTIESFKLSIAQRTATIKLASLTSQIQYEKDILELNIKQQQATLEQDKLKQKISITQAQRDIIGSRSALAKLEISPTASAEDKLAAKLDLQAKEDQFALVQSQGQFLIQQQQMQEYQSKIQRIQLDYTQKGQLQSVIADVGRSSPLTSKAYIENNLANAIGRQEGTEFYKAWADSMIGEAKRNPMVLPTFNSPFDSRSNYNRPGVADPQKLTPSGSVNSLSSAGSLDFTVREPFVPKPVKLPNFPRNPDGSLDIGDGFIIDGRQRVSSPVTPPQLQPVDYSKFQADAQARYQEFVNTPIRLDITPQVQREVQGRSQQRERGENPAPVKPPQVNNIQMTNDIKIQVADGKETKDSIVNISLDSLETIFRLAKERN